MHKKISKCRICGNDSLELVLDLGEQVLTGIFPKSRDEEITKGPLRLVKCTGPVSVCGLLQLDHSYDLDEMYGENYGYRSGLNSSMIMHLKHKINSRENFSKNDKLLKKAIVENLTYVKNGYKKT